MTSSLEDWPVRGVFWFAGQEFGLRISASSVACHRNQNGEKSESFGFDDFQQASHEWNVMKHDYYCRMFTSI